VITTTLLMAMLALTSDAQARSPGGRHSRSGHKSRHFRLVKRASHHRRSLSKSYRARYRRHLALASRFHHDRGFRKSYLSRSRFYRQWTHKCYWNRYRCTCYWCPRALGWFYWCGPCNCYMPIDNIEEYPPDEDAGAYGIAPRMCMPRLR
jgi:hypothetical protein